MAIVDDVLKYGKNKRSMTKTSVQCYNAPENEESSSTWKRAQYGPQRSATLATASQKMESSPIQQRLLLRKTWSQLTFA